MDPKETYFEIIVNGVSYQYSILQKFRYLFLDIFEWFCCRLSRLLSDECKSRVICFSYL